METQFVDVRRWATAISLGLSVVTASVQASPLYSQAPDSGGDLFLSLNSAQNADSFQLGYAASLTSLNFYGTDATPSNLAVRLFAVGAGSLPVDSATGTSLTGALTRGQNPLYTLVSGASSLPVYEFTLTLGTPFVTAAGQTYYLSIFSTSLWAWATSSTGDGKSTYRDGDGTPWQTPVSPDLAFAINGDRIIVNQAPEPASMVLVVMALLAAGSARRRSA